MKSTYLKITLLSIGSLTIMAGATIAPSLPQIQQVFAWESHSELLTKLSLTVPALFIAIFAPLAGILIDRFGRLNLLFFSLLLYGISGTAGFFSPDLYTLLLSRSVLGIAVAGVMTTSITLIADYFKGAERNAFMGLQGAFVAIGGIVFILSGGLLAEISWRAPFLIYLCAFLLIPAALIFLFEPEREKLQPISHSREALIAGKSQISLIYLTTFLGMMLFFIIPVQIPFYIKEQTGATNALTGLAIASSTLSSAIISLNYKRFRKHFSFSQIYAFCFFFLGLGYLVIFMAYSFNMIVLGLLIGGLGMGLLMPNSNIWAVSVSPEHTRGRIVGGLTTAVFLGQFISPVITQPIQTFFASNTMYAFAGFTLLLMSGGFLIHHHRNRSTTYQKN
ncbi:MAG: MFS transporter [Calditrichales bacterium]|nr:MAG: MFS transporter [Calditrichales bacterium]